MIERIVAASASLETGGHAMIPLPELPGRAVCLGEMPIGASRVSIDTGALLTNHTAEIELELLNVLALKTAQSARDGWTQRPLVVVDMARVGLAWLRPEGVWAAILGSFGIDWSMLPFVGLIVAFTSLNSSHFGGARTVRPDATDAEREDINEVIGALGFRPLD